ncbi:hypothetical protein [Massilia sp. TN1-12]|uniref:hypothetical protein n=1 Tax=Massilia paldalensis TaxID=3377675 RepID=UPI00384D5CCD
MIAYEAIGPTSNGDFLIAYPTPGAPHIMTAAGSASSKQAAIDECARRNEAQVIDRRVAMVRKANMIVLDRER